MRLLVRCLARHPAHRILQNTNSPLHTTVHPQFPSEQMLNKLKQKRRKNSSERWRLPRPATHLLVCHLARHPAHHRLLNTVSPIVNRNTPIPFHTNAKKLRQRKRTFSSGLWRLQRPGGVPFDAPPGPASRLSPSTEHHEPYFKL